MNLRNPRGLPRRRYAVVVVDPAMPPWTPAGETIMATWWRYKSAKENADVLMKANHVYVRRSGAWMKEAV